ncbi:tetratricopeptide repeat protein [Rubrobacter indicoceani]|uniref:tetratricopeptide repeat protein n=1 Tax=Rubrobacter indicoceani TaxID=2051957 RepID=UPI000E5A1B6A|nr:tetratricopeptide repeat protein [Rubrobacter indicoceani]
MSDRNPAGSRSEMFRKLLPRDPNNPMILCSLGLELFKEENYEEAREHLQKAVENKPDYSVAFRGLGRSLLELERYDEAREVFRRGREVAEKNGDFQTIKEIDVFSKRLEKRAGRDA